MKKYCVFPLILCTIILFGFSCKTEKNTPINRSYHNLTAYYNVYYNGKEAYKSGLEKIDENHDDNFSLMLPVFKYSDQEAARSAFSDMNRAIEKGSKCIRKHSITNKPKRKPGKKLSPKQKDFRNQKEFVKWIDDSYLLIGKANVIKGDYFPAIETFSFIIRQDETGPLKYESYMWLARTYTEMEKYNKANDFLNKLETDKDLVPEELLGDIAATRADILIRQTKYNDAIPYLETAVEKTQDKKTRTRYNYLLAQLYTEVEALKKAYNTYGLVIEKNPDYKMAFNAKINRASLYNSSSNDSKELQKQLYKMLKDDKNIDYQDQIYYALGKIAQQENQIPEALSFYNKSVKASTENNYQKSLSYLAIADIYFERPDYPQANTYYDSTVTYLDKEHPDYREVKVKSENLNYLVENLTVIQREDSLQRVAQMTEDERIALIDGIIKDLEEAEQKQRELEQQQALNSMYDQNESSLSNTSGGKWYFYNPSTVSAGRGEFLRRWGDRKNEDNWRRKNKSVMEEEELLSEEQSDSTDTKVLDNKSREYYMVNIPLTDSALAASNLKLEEAYFNLAVLYHEKFMDIPLSIQTYEQLLVQFPESSYRLASYYNLYKLHALNNNKAEAEKYKQKIIAEYPDSDYAKILLNPDYYKTLEAKNNQVKFMYQATYKFFINENCAEVANNFFYVDSAFKESKLLPKFELLHTLCQGYSGDTTVFKGTLSAYIKKYPDTEEAGYAQEVLFALDREFRVVELAKIEEKKQEFGGDIDNIDLSDSLDYSMYKYEPNQPHFYVIVVNNQKADDKRVVFNLRNFNLDYYSFLNFEVSNDLLSASYNLLKVMPFKNNKMARNYAESVVIAGEVFEDLPSDAYRTYMMTENNYKRLLEDKNIARFELFYDKYYSAFLNN